ncbi:MAG: hypothetical protein NZ556_03785, partial [Fimbriimonadales bacterium]|nr:hypothetical protein [Fimbriimonadales bacterium]
ALEEVLQEVSRQTGVSLRCQDALREVKVSVFVENGVAATLLENLAKLLGYRWRAREEGGYMLYMPDATRRAFENALKQDRQATEQALREMLQRMREWLRLPRDKRAELLASANMDGAISAAESFEDFMLETGAHDRVQKPEDALRETLAQYLGGYVPRGEEAGTALSRLDSTT